MRKIWLVFAWLAFWPAVSTVSAEPFDLMPYARLTASDTRDTFFLLWPRETEDAPATIRDGDPETGWKPAPDGRQTLWIDFAPVSRRAPLLERLTADWEKAPVGPVALTIYDYCGGPERESVEWPNGQAELVLDEPVRGYCVRLSLIDPGPAVLTEFQVFGAPATEEPEIDQPTLEDLGDDYRLHWTPVGDSVHHLEIHYVQTDGQTPDDANLVDRDVISLAERIPKPATSGYLAAVPVAEDGDTGEPWYLPIEARSAPRLADSGVVEGFYGRPWSHDERRAMLRFLSRLGLGLYIYAPKNDPLHRDNWRESYDSGAMARFFELNQLGAMVGVTFSYGISPGKDLDMESDDPEILLAKLAEFAAGGVRHFTLLFDDIEGDLARPIDGALAAEHVQLANWLKDRLSSQAGEEISLWFVPTVYSTSRQNDWPGGAEYLAVLADLDPDIVVMWTGTGTSSPTLSAADLAEVTALTGRKPAIWENMHATDGGDGFWGRVYLAPYHNRAADLVGAVTGIVANPMILGSADRLMLGTYAEYLRDPAAYDPEAALRRNARLEADAASDRDLALNQAQTWYGFAGVSIWDEPIYPLMEAWMDRFVAVMEAGDVDPILAAGGALLNVAARLAVARDELHHSGLDPLLVDDLMFPADRLFHEGYALLSTLTMAGNRYAGEPADAASQMADHYLLAGSKDRYQLSVLVTALFKSRVARGDLVPFGFVAPVIVDPETMTARQGEAWSYSPSPDGSPAIFGLPGASVREREVVWTPTHPGVYHALLTVRGANGWAWRDLAVTVSAATDDDAVDDDDDDDDNDDSDRAATDDEENNVDDSGCGC
ncbi:MAG: hypothetical protein GX444_03080 [Myxococcales bacterium]|nr:hypothetical protein [Myxococcales bacterium]